MAEVRQGRRAPGLQHCFNSISAEHTFALGAALGRVIDAGDFIGLIGELGAGKTQLVRGVAEGAGVPKSEVASPSFAIVYPYQGRLPILHADFFRIADYDELYATGFTDLVGDAETVLVEWLDRVPQAAPAELLVLTFETSDLAQERRIIARAFGARYVELLRAWIAATT